VQHHALAEDDELGAVLVDDLLGLLDVDLEDVVLAHREVHDRAALGYGIDGDIVVQRAHGLRREVTALDDVVVEHVAQTLRRVLAVKAVLPVHQRGERAHVGHLATEDAGLDLGALKVLLHLLDGKLLGLVDEARALIIEDVLVVEGLDLLVLGVAAAGVAGAERLHGVAGRVLGGDQVDALFLAPEVVLLRALEELQRLDRTLRRILRALAQLEAVDDRAGIRRCHVVEVLFGDDRLEALAAHIDLDDIVLQHVGGDVAGTDGALDDLVGDDGLKPLALRLVVRDHRAACDPADPLAIAEDLHARAHDAAVDQRDGTDGLGQRRQVGEITVLDALERLALLLQRLAADVVALEVGKADGELRQRHGEDRHRHAVGVDAHLVPVERHARLQTQRVARAEARGLRAQLDQAVPQPLRVLGLDVHLVTQRLAGVAGLGDAGEVPLQLQRAERVLHRLGDGGAAGERHHQLLALRTLHRDRRPVGGDVRQRAVIVLDDGHEVVEILVRVRRVDHQQEAILLEAVEIRVVDGAAVFVGDDAVLRLLEVKARHVAREHVLQELDAIRSLDEDAPHVGHVEQGAEVAGVEVLGDDLARIFDGHFPSPEVYHRRARRDMGLVKLGPLEFAHCVPSFLRLSCIKIYFAIIVVFGKQKGDRKTFVLSFCLRPHPKDSRPAALRQPRLPLWCAAPPRAAALSEASSRSDPSA